MKPPLIILAMATLSHGMSISWDIEEEQAPGTMILDIAQELGFNQPPDRTDTFSVSFTFYYDKITHVVAIT